MYAEKSEFGPYVHKDRHSTMEGDAQLDAFTLALLVIVQQVDGVTSKQQRDIFAYVLRPVGLQWKAVVERADRFEPEPPYLPRRTSKFGDRLPDRQSGDLSADVNFLDVYIVLHLRFIPSIYAHLLRKSYIRLSDR